MPRKTLVAIGVAAVVVIVLRTLTVTLYTITDDSLSPDLLQGDRVMVNRWSYGLRTGGSATFRYTRWMKSPINKGDIIAFNVESDSFLPKGVRIGRVVATPGDTISAYGKQFVIPNGCQLCNCGYPQQYMVGSNKAAQRIIVHEKDIIGRAFIIMYNLRKFHFDPKRWLLPIR